MPTTAQLIATFDVAIAKIQADNAQDQKVDTQRQHYETELAASKMDDAEGQGRR